MNTKDTPAPAQGGKLGITPGKWFVEESANWTSAAVIKSCERNLPIANVWFEGCLSPAECVAHPDAQLLAEAGTVANETGLTPRQLADQRAELLEALESSVQTMLQFIPKAARGYRNPCFKYVVGGVDMWDCDCPICRARRLIAGCQKGGTP